MAVYLSAFTLGVSLVFGQVSPYSGINPSSPCAGGHLIQPPLSNATSENQALLHGNYITLYQQVDVDAIANCQVFNGSIFIDPTLQGDVILPNLTTINNGGLLAVNGNDNREIPGNLTGLIFPKLENISLNETEFLSQEIAEWSSPLSGLLVTNITSIRTIWLPALFTYTGDLLISDLPELTNLSTFSNLKGQNNLYGTCAVNNFEVSNTNVSSIVIQTYCMLNMRLMGNSKLDKISLQTQNITNLTISAANIVLQRFSDGPFAVENLDVSYCQTYEADDFDIVNGTFSLHDTTASIASVTIPVYGDLIVANNAELTALNFAPSHTYPKTELSFSNIDGDFNISNCPSLQGASLAGAGIKNLSGSLNITDNYALTNISLPDLTSIGGSIFISNCDAITSISLPNLESIGGDFIITNNTHLSIITSLTSLQVISGKIEFQGNFSKIDLPLLEHSFNGFYIDSTNPEFDCSEFDQYKSQYLIRGNYICVSSKSGGNTHITSSKSPLSIGAEVGIGVSVGTVGIALIAILLCLLKKKDHSQLIKPTEELDGTKERDGTPELPQGKHYEQVEAPAISKPGELQGELFPGHELE